MLQASSASADDNEPPVPDDVKARLRILNPDVDRKAVVKGCLEPEKLDVILNNLPGKAPISARFPRAGTMDWNNADDVRALNRWRAQRFRFVLALICFPSVVAYSLPRHRFLLARA